MLLRQVKAGQFGFVTLILNLLLVNKRQPKHSIDACSITLVRAGNTVTLVMELGLELVLHMHQHR
jgi:hypothetical protein